jgi:hypothetical protein
LSDVGEGSAALRMLLKIAGRETGKAGADLIDHLVRRGVIEREPSGMSVLTATGRAALRRGLSGVDGFQLQHQARNGIVVRDDEGIPQAVVVNDDESPLARLRRAKGRDGRPLIDDAEFAAGERLRADFNRGQMMPRVTANWSAAVSAKRRDGGAGGIADLTEAALGARFRVERALVAVGPEFAGLIVDFCRFLKGIEEIEHERAWPVRSAKLVLRLALAALARHYGLAASATGASRGRLVHWGTEDYRPRISDEGNGREA